MQQRLTEREPTAEEEEEAQGRAIGSLLAEARSQYPGGAVLAATDFFTLHVPFTGPGAAAAAAAIAAGGAEEQ